MGRNGPSEAVETLPAREEGGTWETRGGEHGLSSRLEPREGGRTGEQLGEVTGAWEGQSLLEAPAAAVPWHVS